MARQNSLWIGRPSQLSNFWVFVLFFWTLIIPLWVFITTRFTVYELTEDRFFDRKGVLLQKTNQLELIRIRDYEVSRTLLQRIFGKGNLKLITRDETSPVILLSWISNAEDVAETIRNASEAAKTRKGFREVEAY